MNKVFFLILVFTSLVLTAWGTSIYDIQYTSFPGSDNTYPSRLVGKSVTTEGIVTAINSKSGGFYISEPLSGAYSGLFINDRKGNITIGDRVRITGTVRESFGMTCLQDVSNIITLERNHPLPHPVALTTAQLTRAEEAEAFESVYAKVLSVSTANSRSSRGKISVTDGTGLCTINLSLLNDNNQSKSQGFGTQFISITGIVFYSFGEFSLNPVSRSDIVVNQPVSIQNRSWGKIKSIYK